MAKILERLSSRKSLVIAFLLLLMVGSFISYSYGEENNSKVKCGFSFLAGINARSKPNLTQIAVLPRMDLALHRYWDLELEGNISYYSISGEKDLYLLGTGVNLLFEPIQLSRVSLFALGGGGLGYTNSNGKIKEIADFHLAGIAQAGAGIVYNFEKRWALRAEYRFLHISVPFKRDIGINTHNLLLGVSF